MYRSRTRLYPFGYLTVLAAGFVMAAPRAHCCAAETQAPADAPTDATRDLFGEPLPQPDPARAQVPLADVPPPIQKPSRPVEAQDPSDRVQRILDRVSDLRKERRFTEAIIELERAQRYEPDHPVVHRMLAQVQWEAGNAERARTHVEKVLARGDDDIVCHYILARLAAGRFENQEAVREFRLALACTHDESTADWRTLTQFHLADLLAVEGYLTAAIGLYEEFRDQIETLDPAKVSSAELAALVRAGAGAVNLRVASAYENLGRFGEAARQIEAAHPDGKMSAETRLRYAKNLARAGQFEAAADQAGPLLADEPGAAEILTAIYAKMDAPQRILADLEALVDKNPDQEGLVVALASALHRFGRTEDAERRLSEFVNRHPDALDSRWTLFDLLVEGRQWRQAFDVAADAVRHRREWSADAVSRVLSAGQPLRDAVQGDAADDFAAQYLHGELARSGDRTDDAIAHLAGAVEAAPEFVAARVALGEIYLDRFEWQKAIDVGAPEGLKLESDTRIELLLGKAYAGLDRYTEAAAHLANATRLNRTNTEAMLALAEVYESAGEPTRSLRQLESVVNADPVNEIAREKLFAAYLADDNPRAAAEQVVELRRLAASPTRIARCVAIMELKRDSPDYARFRKTLQDAIDQHKPDADTLHLLAISHVQEDGFEAAVPLLQQALGLDPGHMPSADLLVACHRARLEFEEALTLQERLLSRRPNRENWKRSRLDLLLILQRYDEAIEFAMACAAATNEPRVTNQYHAVAFQTHVLIRSYDGAVALLEQMRKEREDEDALTYTLVQVLLMGGKHDQAMEHLRKWFQRAPGDLAQRGHLPIWRRLQPAHVEEVKQMLVESVVLDPENDERQFALIEFLKEVGQYDEALELARNNAASGYRSEDYQLLVFDTLDRAGRLKEAIELIEQLLLESGGPDNRTPFSQLGLRIGLIQVLLKAERHEQARDTLNRWLRATDSQDERMTYLHLLAACHQEAGDVTDAIEVLTLAKDMDPEETGINNDLGYTLADAGRNLDEAERMIRKAVADEPRNGAYLDSLGWVLYKKKDFEGAKLWLTRSSRSGDSDGDGENDGDDPVVLDHLGDACWQLGEKEEARQHWQRAAELAETRLTRPLRRSVDQAVLEAVKGKLAAIDAGQEPKVAAAEEVTP